MSRRYFIKVRTPNGMNYFHFFARVADGWADSQMSDSFYVKKYGILPTSQHAEFLIYSEEILKHRNAALLHFELSGDGKNSYICWPTPLPEYQCSTIILWAWCVGTAYTMQTGIDFGTLLEEWSIEPGHFQTFIEHMEERHQITVTAMSDGD